MIIVRIIGGPEGVIELARYIVQRIEVNLDLKQIPGWKETEKLMPTLNPPDEKDCAIAVIVKRQATRATGYDSEVLARTWRRAGWKAIEWDPARGIDLRLKTLFATLRANDG